MVFGLGSIRITAAAALYIHPRQAGFSLLFERSPLPMLMFERMSYRLLEGNAAAAQALGYALDRLLALKLNDLFYPQDWQQAQDTLHAPLLSAPASSLRWRMRAHSGKQVDVDVVPEPVVYGGVNLCLLQFHEVGNTLAPQQPRQGSLSQAEHSILENLNDGFFHLDPEGRFTYLNRRAQELFRATPEALRGRYIWDCHPHAIGAEHRRRHDKAMANQLPSSYEMFFEPWTLWHEVRLYPSESGVSVCFRDVTQRRGVWQRLLEEREFLSAIVNGSNEAIITIDAEGRIQSVNPGAERIFGLSSSAVLGQCVDLLLPERFRAAHAQHRDAFLHASSNGARMMGLRLVKGLRSDGQELDLEGSIAKVSMDERMVLIVTLRDVSQRAALEAERQNARNQLSRLTHKLMSQEKDLVKRIAQALHDQLGQTMAAIRLVHETIGTVRQKEATPELQQLDARLSGLIEQAISQVRVVLVELQPPMLDEYGLAAALDNELRKRVHTSTGMQFELEVPPGMARLRWPPAVEYAAFMIVREAVENAVRHSQATRLVLRLSGDTSELTLDIQDNGCGVEDSPAASPGHLGWASIKERANSINASVGMAPGPDGGTCVHFHWQELA